MAPFHYLPERSGRAATPLLTLAIVIAALYVGRDVLAPLALALLLTIAALPVVEWLERRRLPRALAVAVVLVIVILLVLGLVGLLAQQVYHLAADLPRYEFELREKLQAFGSGSGPFEEVGKLFQRLGNVIFPPDPADTPIVTMREPPASPFATIGSLLKMVLTPVAILAVTLLLMGFVLMQREDLRDRALRLAGTRDLHRTTRIMQESTTRVGRFLLMNILVNAVFGSGMGIGLWLLGVPNAPLWGVLAFALRFIPFLGAPLSALLPAAVAFATTDGWTTVLLVIGWFLVVDIAVTYALEPWIYGSSTGVTPIAVVVSAIFWAALWGPVGLILAPPITACLAILGRSLPGLGVLDVLLSNRAPLAPPERFYQRLLAGDAPGAARMLAVESERADAAAALRHLAQPALTRLAADRREEDFEAAMVLGAARTLMKALETEASDALGEPEIAVIGVGGALDQAGAALTRVALQEAGHVVADRLDHRPVGAAVLVLAGRVQPARLRRALLAARSNAREVRLLLIGGAEAPQGAPQGETTFTSLEDLLEHFEPKEATAKAA
jgi:predicted PurR-regulated permease PerM